MYLKTTSVEFIVGFWDTNKSCLFFFFLDFMVLIMV